MTSKKRKSFVLHLDVLSVLDDLTNEQAGMLFKAIKANRLGENIELDAITKIAFSPFKAQFARDDEKYEKIVERNKNNGSKGGRPKNQTEPKKPTGLIGNPKNPQKADSDSDSDKDSDQKNACFDSFWRNWVNCKKEIGLGRNYGSKSDAKKKWGKVCGNSKDLAADTDEIINFMIDVYSDIKLCDETGVNSQFFNYKNKYPQSFLEDCFVGRVFENE